MFSSVKEFARFFDHTLLKADATESQIIQLCHEAAEYGFFGVCVNGSYVKLAAETLMRTPAKTIAVVGFPLGSSSIESKVYETKTAIEDGAVEIDTVVHLGAYFSGSERYVRKDIAEVVRAAGNHPVKVILETANLKPEDIRTLCQWSIDEGAKFVKTSTGFAARGASTDDVQIMQQAIADAGATRKVEIKASGGIKTLQACKDLINAGATRIGSSASVAILKEYSQSS